MKTIKIKLPFSRETKLDERKNKLTLWASAMLKGARINIIEEKHLDTISYIVVENTKISVQ